MAKLNYSERFNHHLDFVTPARNGDGELMKEINNKTTDF